MPSQIAGAQASPARPVHREVPKAYPEVAKPSFPWHTISYAGSTASSLQPEQAAGCAAQGAPQHHLTCTDPAVPSTCHDTRAGVSDPAATYAGRADPQQEAAGLRDSPSQKSVSQAAASSGSASAHTPGTSATGATLGLNHPSQPGCSSPLHSKDCQGLSTIATLQLNDMQSKPSHDPGRSDSSSAASQQSAEGQTASDSTRAPAQFAALRPISAADFEVAMQRIRPSITRDFSVELAPGMLCTCQHSCSRMHALQTNLPGPLAESWCRNLLDSFQCPSAWRA